MADPKPMSSAELTYLIIAAVLLFFIPVAVIFWLAPNYWAAMGFSIFTLFLWAGLCLFPTLEEIDERYATPKERE